MQIIVWSVIPAIKYSLAEHGNDMLVLVALFQYVLRLCLIFSLSNKIIKVSGVFAKTAWQGAAYNLLLYMIASHV
jgi:cyclic nucleotide gated channel, plant